MTATRPSGRDRSAASPFDTLLAAALGHRVRGLSVEIRAGHLFLRGRTDSFHVKQLAQHTAMAMTELPLAANEIEVVPGPRRVILATGDDRVRADGRARLADLGWEVATAHGGLDCVAHLRRSLWDVAVLDADLLWGGADGVLADIADGTSHAPSVVFLGNPPQLRGGGRGARVSAVLEKPVDVEAMARAV